MQNIEELRLLNQTWHRRNRLVEYMQASDVLPLNYSCAHPESDDSDAESILTTVESVITEITGLMSKLRCLEEKDYGISRLDLLKFKLDNVLAPVETNGSLIYQLNSNGENLWTLKFEPGFRNKERLSQQQADYIHRLLFKALINYNA